MWKYGNELEPFSQPLALAHAHALTLTSHFALSHFALIFAHAHALALTSHSALNFYVQLCDLCVLCGKRKIRFAKKACLLLLPYYPALLNT